MKKRTLYSQIETSLNFIHESIKVVQDHKNSKYFLSHTDSQGLKARDHLFSLEGLLRLHIKTYNFSKKDLKIANKLLLTLKKFEDLIGLLSLQIELKNESSYVNEKVNKSKLFTFLKEEWNLTKINTYKNSFLKLKFKHKKKQVKQMLNSEINRIQEKSDSLEKHINQSPYNIEVLELGFHEWRRAIRWISIYLQFYKINISLIEQKYKTPHKLILQKFKNSPFMDFEENNKELIKVDLTKYYLLSHFIYKSGKVKESVELNLYLNKKQSTVLERNCRNVYNQFNEYKILEGLLL